MLVYGLTFAMSMLLAGWAEMRAQARDSGIVLPRRFTTPAFLVFVVLAGVSALRWGVGTDYWNYVLNFEMYVSEFLDGPGPLDEPGIRLFAWLADRLGAGSAGMLALAAIITMGLFVRTLWRWSPSFALSIPLLLLTGVWHDSFNAVRQYLACAVLFAGHRYLIDRRPIQWGLVIVTASLFHVSALVCALLYFVPTARTSLRIQAFIFAIGISAMFGFESVLGWIELVTGDVGLSEGSYSTRSINPLRIAFAFVPVLLFWILKNYNAIRERHAWFYVNMLAIHAAIYLGSANSAYLARFSIYSAPFLAIGLVSVTSVPNRAEQSLIRGFLLVIYAVFLYVDVSGSRDLVFRWIFYAE